MKLQNLLNFAGSQYLTQYMSIYNTNSYENIVNVKNPEKFFGLIFNLGIAGADASPRPGSGPEQGHRRTSHEPRLPRVWLRLCTFWGKTQGYMLSWRGRGGAGASYSFSSVPCFPFHFEGWHYLGVLFCAFLCGFLLLINLPVRMKGTRLNRSQRKTSLKALMERWNEAGKLISSG